MTKLLRILLSPGSLKFQGVQEVSYKSHLTCDFSCSARTKLFFVASFCLYIESFFQERTKQCWHGRTLDFFLQDIQSSSRYPAANLVWTSKGIVPVAFEKKRLQPSQQRCRTSSHGTSTRVLSRTSYLFFKVQGPVFRNFGIVTTGPWILNVQRQTWTTA